MTDPGGKGWTGGSLLPILPILRILPILPILL